MELKVIPLTSIRINELFLLSDPAIPELFLKHEKMFPGIPQLILNGKNELISGYDSFLYLKERDVKDVEVMITALNVKDSLFLGYNRRRMLKEPNLFEKVLFVGKMGKYSDLDEIYNRSGMDIRISRDMINDPWLFIWGEGGELLKKNRVTLKTVRKVNSMNKSDRRHMFSIFSVFKMSSSSQKKFIDIIDDILFRDKCSVRDVIKRTGFDYLKNGDKGFDEFFKELLKIRYPEYLKYEMEWKEEVDKLDLPGDWKIYHSDFFEKPQLEIKIIKRDLKQLKEMLKKLKG